jgi:hypothetical protein
MFQGGPSQGGDNSNELSLPLPSTIRELEKVCFLPNLDFAYRTFYGSLITSLFFFSTTLTAHLVDQCITWVYQLSLQVLLSMHRFVLLPPRTQRLKRSMEPKSQTIRGRRGLPSEKGHSPTRKTGQSAQHFCMLARTLLSVSCSR